MKRTASTISEIALRVALLLLVIFGFTTIGQTEDFMACAQDHSHRSEILRPYSSSTVQTRVEGRAAQVYTCEQQISNLSILRYSDKKYRFSFRLSCPARVMIEFY